MDLQLTQELQAMPPVDNNNNSSNNSNKLLLVDMANMALALHNNSNNNSSNNKLLQAERVTGNQHILRAIQRAIHYQRVTHYQVALATDYTNMVIR